MTDDRTVIARLRDRIAGRLAMRSTANWWPARRRVALLALAAAFLTAAAGATLGAGVASFTFIAAAVFAALFPAAIVVEVVAGLLLVRGLLSGLQGTSGLLLVPVVAGVVLTAELLAIAGRLDAPVERDPGEDPRRAAVAAALGGGVFAVVLMIAALPGPTGLLAIAIASAACLGLALLLAHDAPSSTP